MFENKKDVDKYVEKLSAKLSKEEIIPRAYSIARLYFNVGDYANCQKYVELYLTQKDNNAAAHKLLGQALQKSGQKDKALEHYETSFDIDPTQTSTITDICELLVDDNTNIKSARAKYWCEKAEATFPKHPATFRLREKLVMMSNPDPEALISLLTTELTASPKDPTLHIRLLRHYMNVNKLKEAFDHCCSVEFSQDNFLNNLSWYESLDEVLKKYYGHTKDWLYQLLVLTVKERLCLLSLTEIHDVSKNLVQINELLHDYDQTLEIIAKAGPESGFAEFHAGLLQHHRGQFSFYIATYLLKKAKKDQINWREATKLASPLMLIAWQTVPLDVKVNWLKLAPEKQLIAVHRWYTEGTYRCSQAGHYLITNYQDKSRSFLDQVSQHCSGTNWKDKLYKSLFANETILTKTKTSFLMSNAFVSPILRLPRKMEVIAYDVDAQRQHGNSLHHFVWMLLNYTNYAEFKCILFDMLKPNSASIGPETLNKYDCYAFLLCSTLTAQQHRGTERSYVAADKPSILPANITDLLCSSSQMKWWDCAYKFSQNILGSELTDIRATLSRGIEVVRCVDNHSLDPVLLCNLGRIFNDISKNINNVEEKIYVEKRATLYFNSAIPILEKLKNKIVIKISDNRLFDYTHKDLNARELNNLIEESKLHVASNLIKDEEFDKVIEILDNVKTPQAFYYLAQTYKKIAMNEQNSSMSKLNSKYSALLAKAKKYAYKTLDELKETDSYKTNPLYAEVQELIEDIEIHISKIDPDISDYHITEAKYSSDENISYQTEQTRMKTNLLRNISSTPKTKQNSNNTNYRTAMDSQILEITRMDQQHLDRIENEIRNLQKRDTTITDFMDQTKVWFEENRKLGNQIISTIQTNIQNTTDQFKSLKISVDQVKDQIDECRNECKDVGELKKQIAELKKEVNKLKKSSEHTIDETDLYNLDEEYRSTENTSNYAPQLPFASQMMPPFNQRPPFPIPPNPYQLYNQSLYNLYNQYTQFAQSSTVPGASQLFDATRAQLNYPGVYPTPDQMYLDVAHLIPPPVPTAQTIPPVSVAPPIPVVTSKAPVSTMPSVAPMSTPNLATAATTFKTSTPTSSSKDVAKSLPVNVVITSSDPLPTCVSTPVPVLSVTIPQKHIKGIPHNYQITMPTANETKVSPPVFSFTMPENKSDVTNSTSMWKQTKSNTEDSSYKLQFPMYGQNTSINNSNTVVDGPFSASQNTSINKSRTLSEKSNTSIENYDPCPDFKPIVPLPAEVKVTTGEEDETAVFSARAKLFRFVNKEWKERGLGEMKLLKHNVTGKVRVLMRREQVHKICANHIITPDMEINQRVNEAKAYVWVANDFADERFTLETFCVRFKTAELAKSFYDAFIKARSEATSPNTSLTETKSEIKTTVATSLASTAQIKEQSMTNKEQSTTDKEQPAFSVSNQGKAVFGGFTFNTTPMFKPVDKDENKAEVSKIETENTKSNVFTGISFMPNTSTPFSGLTFNTTTTNSTSKTETVDINKDKLNTSDTVEEFEPNVEFKPVIPLPALVEQKTGEEDEKVLFEHRAKLLRFDSNNKEWKERGLGNIKLLVHKDNNQKVRLLMRREQIMKVCCNHSVTKEMTFQKMPNMDKAVTWCAKDFSEGDLVSETFCLRFKTVQLCNDFMEAIKSAQNKMTDDTKAAKEEQNAAKQNNKTTTSGWGDKFKPKPGSWECQSCLVRNGSQNDTCSACNSPKDPTSKSNSTEKPAAAMTKFTFGIPGQNLEVASQKTATAPQKVESSIQKVAGENKISTTGFGDKFKPKEGSWECKQCFVRNDSSSDNCCACNSSKDPNAPKENKSSNSGNAPTVKFRFGIPPAPTSEEVKPVPSIFGGTGGQKFSFGIPSNASTKPSDDGDSNEQKYTAVLFAAPKAPNESPINFSLKNNFEATKTDAVTITPVKQSQTDSTNVFGAKDSTFGFVFKPSNAAKSPVKSPRSQGDESDGEDYVKEEDCHAQFNPVIPLPDKVEVVTGEENESELYGHRAKLYRFVSGEWKERGTGVVKILKHNVTNKLRIVMRREQVLKICLNHALTPDITYTPKDEKTWLFYANDFSEGEINLQHFCIRFANKEIAMQFKEAVDNARQGKSTASKPAEVKTTNEEKIQSTGDEDVVFVSETQATAEEKEKARELMLPENFYTYKNKNPCQGCRGCDDEGVKIDKMKIQTQPQLSTTSSTFSPVSTAISTPVKAVVSKSSSPTISLYGTPGNSDKTIDNSIFRTPLGSIGSNTHSLTPTNNTSDVSDIDTKNKENIFTQKSNFFTNFGEQKSLFGTAQSSAITMLGESASQASVPVTKSSVLATPKLSTANTSTDKPETKSIFASNPVKPASTTTGSIFGAPSVTNNKFTFGGFNKDNITDSETETKSIFSGDFQKPVNIFSGNTQGTSIFNTGSFTNNNAKPFETSSIFSSASTQNTGNSFKTLFSNTIWNSDDTKSNESNPVTSCNLDTKTSAEPAKEEPLFTKAAAEILGFANVSSTGPGFQKNTNFQWEGAGQQLFTAASKQSDKSKKDSSVGDESGAADEEYDPHYEPIVPLPEKITVTTGEEDEEKVFAERCKLFRYDEKAKEWKERGVGEMKILYHPQRDTYRLLLRREQVFKAVLNMLLYTELELLPMKNSDRAWTWVGKNYAEIPEGEQEMLAVRFKNTDLANKFRDQVVQCVRKLQAAAAKAIREEKEAKEKTAEIAPLRLPKHLADSARADSNISAAVAKQTTTPEAETASEPKPNGESEKQVQFEEVREHHDEYDEDEDYEHGYHDHNDYDGYYNEEEDENGAFYSCEGEAVVKQGVDETTCSNAHIQVMFDQEIYSPKILITDANTGEILADMLIHTDTEFQMSGESCKWSGIDYTTNEPIDKTITVNFYDTDTAMQFYDSCETSKAATYSSNDPES